MISVVIQITLYSLRKSLRITDDENIIRESSWDIFTRDLRPWERFKRDLRKYGSDHRDDYILWDIIEKVRIALGEGKPSLLKLLGNSLSKIELSLQLSRPQLLIACKALSKERSADDKARMVYFICE